ncbi:Uma2 family endonuclease [Streptomyces sp. NPDC003233]
MFVTRPLGRPWVQSPCRCRVRSATLRGDWFASGGRAHHDVDDRATDDKRQRAQQFRGASRRPRRVGRSRLQRTTGNRLDGESLTLAAELTSSSTRDDDLTDKAVVYGRAGVPVYLLLDMQEERATVFWGPSPKGYESRETRPFGEKLHIPAPFDCTLDTTGFEAPASS